MLVTLAAISAHAMHPLDSDDADTVGAGVTEVELSLALEELGTLLAPGICFHLGAHERLDVGVNLAYEVVPSAGTAGLAPPLLDAKLQLVQGVAERPALSVRADYAPAQTLPAPGLGHELAAHVLASWGGERASAHVNAGGVVYDVGTSPELRAVGAASVHAAVVPGALILVEALGTTGPAWEPDLVLLGGAALELPGAGVFSAGLGLDPAARGASGWSASVGFTTTLHPAV